MGIKFIKVSVIYFVIGVLMGFYMSITNQFTLTGVHVHISLLGWSSMTLAGILYTMFPVAGENKLAKIHFWLKNIGLPIMMIALAGYVLTGNAGLGPVIGIGGTLVVISVILFAINILSNVRK